MELIQTKKIRKWKGEIDAEQKNRFNHNGLGLP